MHPQSISSPVDDEKQVNISFVSMSSLTTDDPPQQLYCKRTSDKKLFFHPHSDELIKTALVVWMKTKMLWRSTNCSLRNSRRTSWMLIVVRIVSVLRVAGDILLVNIYAGGIFKCGFWDFVCLDFITICRFDIQLLFRLNSMKKLY